MPTKKQTTCMHTGTDNQPDCTKTATWDFLIAGIRTLACDTHKPSYAATSATPVITIEINL